MSGCDSTYSPNRAADRLNTIANPDATTSTPECATYYPPHEHTWDVIGWTSDGFMVLSCKDHPEPVMCRLKGKIVWPDER